MRLYHFSHDGGIEHFVPRPVAVPSERAPGREWLNGPLVWAIEERRQAMYLFPRECPRILLWATPASTRGDVEAWLGGDADRTVAHIEPAWAAELPRVDIWRYELPPRTFQDLDDAGMWISRVAVTPIARRRITDLPGELAAIGVELRVVADLRPLTAAYDTSLHFSGIRLRNAGQPPELRTR